MKISASFVLLALLLSGCAVGHRYDYSVQTIPLPVQGDASIVLLVEDARPYVLNGDKSPQFVGLQRGGFGNPFDVNTLSGRPLAVDMGESLARALEAKGFSVTDLSGSTVPAQQIAEVIARENADRMVRMVVFEWKSDIYVKLGLHTDLVLKVYDASGNLLAENKMSDFDNIGGGAFEKQNSSAVALEFEKRMGILFKDPKIIEALEK